MGVPSGRAVGRAVESAGGRATGLLLLALSAGCVAPAAGPQPIAASVTASDPSHLLPPPAAGPSMTEAAGVALSLRRVGEDGAPLPVQAEVWDPATGECLLALDGCPPEPARLPPGEYRLMIFERPLPFGFAVLLEPERPVDVLICSDDGGRAHAVGVETLRRPLGGGVTLVERQVLGFGWGPPPPLPVGPREHSADSTAVTASHPRDSRPRALPERTADDGVPRRERTEDRPPNRDVEPLPWGDGAVVEP